METITEARITATEAIKDRFGPVLDRVEKKSEQARRAFVHGRHAAEGFVAETRMQVRRRPLRAMGIAATAGALAGCVLGFAIGWRTHHVE
jgi:ElaB/YqjD/DUF883 family membrane-anchored ribosome-binding protein